MTAALDVRTDHGLRRALRLLRDASSWETPPGHAVLAEIRHRAVRTAAHIARATDTRSERGLVDDIVTEAWLVLHRNQEDVLAAQRPWAYLMRSAQRRALEEVRAQRCLTRTTLIRSDSRHLLPRSVSPVGATAAELATAFRHEPSDPHDVARRQLRVTHSHGQPSLTGESAEPGHRQCPWLNEFVDLLVSYGADERTTVAAIDRLADMFLTTRRSYWEHVARRDPALHRLGLTPDQCSALVALLAGPRSRRHTARGESLLARTRAATDSGRGAAPTPPQLQRIAAFTVRAEAAERRSLADPRAA